jgi:hypothetical protein
MMRERIRQGDSASHAAERLLKIIERKGVGALKDPTAEARHRTIASVVEASIDLTSAEGQRLAELSIFPEDVAIPLPRRHPCGDWTISMPKTSHSGWRGSRS